MMTAKQYTVAKEFWMVKVGRQFLHDGTEYIKMDDRYDRQNAMSTKGQRIKFHSSDWVEV